ncbi:hypothetical protein RTBOTA2_000044, partial [Rhodotorula toruloides]
MLSARSTAPPYASQVTRKRFDLARYKRPSRAFLRQNRYDGLLLHWKLNLHLRILLRLQEVIPRHTLLVKLLARLDLAFSFSLSLLSRSPLYRSSTSLQCRMCSRNVPCYIP